MKKQQLLAKHVDPGSVFYDIGANVGVYTLIASLLSGSKGHVYGFEPVERNLYYLKKHIKINSLANVTIIDSAVCDKGGEYNFSLGKSNSMGRVDSFGDLKVLSVKLDTFCLTHRSPDVIKMDIEGGEFAALAGASEMLKQYKPTIFLATHGSKSHNDCCDYLKDIGYTLSSVDGQPVEYTDELIAVYE